jgi:hypothetical protein
VLPNNQNALLSFLPRQHSRNQRESTGNPAGNHREIPLQKKYIAKISACYGKKKNFGNIVSRLFSFLINGKLKTENGKRFHPRETTGTPAGNHRESSGRLAGNPAPKIVNSNYISILRQAEKSKISHSLFVISLFANQSHSGPL